MSDPLDIIDLDAIFDRLKAAKPSPEEVEKMTADLLDRRRHPYGQEIFELMMLAGYNAYECKLCGANVRSTIFPGRLNTFNQHIAFHNDTEYRLRTLEGK